MGNRHLAKILRDELQVGGQLSGKQLCGEQPWGPSGQEADHNPVMHPCSKEG